MNRLYFSKLLVLIVVLLGWNVNVNAQGLTYTFTYGNSQGGPTFTSTRYFTVPVGTSKLLSVDIEGARGGYTDYTPSNSSNGNGGAVSCEILVTPGQVLQINLGDTGRRGQAVATSSFTANAGGFNGGGTGYGIGAGGGGATDIRTGGYTLSDRLVVAGGGGGWGGGGAAATPNYNAGGCGGGLTGEAGWYNNTRNAANTGQGGTPTAGGAKATNTTYNQTDGSVGVGGNGENNNLTNYGQGGGGGGGYYGGGGAAFGGGGGGSSWASPTLASNINTNQCANAGQGYVIFTADCITPVAGAIVGPSSICGGDVVPFTNPTSSGGGYWVSRNPGVLSINATTGVATTLPLPYGSGYIDVVIVDSFTYPCNLASIAKTSPKTIRIYPKPDPITTDFGVTRSVCMGNCISLYSSGPGVWTSSNTNIAGLSYTTGSGLATMCGIAAGTATISYTLPPAEGSCRSVATATINPVPAPITIAGSITNLCQTTAPGTILASDVTPGGVWSWSGPTSVFNTGTHEINTQFSGSGVITYSLTGTGCVATKSFSVDLKPTVYSVYQTAGPARCSNGDGINVYIQTEADVYYQLYKNLVPLNTPALGDNSTLDFGKLKNAGNYTVIATSKAGCVTNMSGSATITVDQAPTPLTVTLNGPAAFCENLAGPSLDINPTELGLSPVSMIYNLRDANGIVNSAYGNGGLISFPITQTGIYYIEADDLAGAGGVGCFTNMIGTYTITKQPQPQADNLTGGGAYCLNGNGVSVNMDNSLVGVTYDLSHTPIGGGASTYDTTVPGTGAGFTFGKKKTEGEYHVVITNQATGCYIAANEPVPVVVTINPLPNVDTISGTVAMCANNKTGTPIILDSSSVDYSYQLLKNGVPVGGTLTGLGAPNLAMGTVYPGTAGTGDIYTAMATDLVTGCVSTMGGTAVVTSIPIPAAEVVTGGGGYCIGTPGVTISVNPSEFTATYQLMDGTNPIQVPIPGDGGKIDFISVTDLGTFTVLAKNATTGCINTMTGTSTVFANKLPIQYPVATTNGGSYCAGTPGVHIALPFSGLGINYQLFHGGAPVSSLIPGSNSGIDFGLYTATGTYSVVGTNASTTCNDTMQNTVTVSATPPPAVFAVTASGTSYCSGDPGVTIFLASSEASAKYQFYRSGLPLDAPVTGTGLALDFGLRTLPGAYSVIATDTISGCVSNMFGNAVVTINSLPTVYIVGGGGQYCTGSTGVKVTLNNSDTWIKYQLYVGGSPAGTPKSGTGGLLDFGLQTTPGVYTVMAVNPTTTCVSSMLGSATVSVKALPMPYYLSGSGDVCTGSTGNKIMLSSSETGVTYQLYKNGIAIDAAIAGLSTALNFGIHSDAGKYTIKGTRTATGCSSWMADSAVINVLPLPTAYTLSGSSTFCAGSPGAHVTISGSTVGVNYQLQNGSTMVGPFITGSGVSLDFGTPSVSGTYDVVATDALTGCSSKMLSAAVVKINPLPAPQTMTGTGHYCAGTSGASIGLTFSEAGVNYQLNMGGTPVGTTKPGGGYYVDLGLQKTVGTYTVTGINAATGCKQDMTGSVDVVIDAVTPPSVTIASGVVGDTLCAGRSYTFTAMPVNGGATPSYSWSVNGGSPSGFASTYSYVPATGDILSVTMGSSAACATPTTAFNNIILTTQLMAMPSAAITGSPSTAVCAGTPITFTATSMNEGYAPTKVWYVNNKEMARGTNTFVYTPNDKDVVIMHLASSYACRLADSVFSNTFETSVDPGLIPVVTIVASQGTTLAPGQLDTFIAAATHVGLAPKYQWFENGAVISGATTSKYISNKFFDGDSVSCKVTSSTACGLTGENAVVIKLCSTCPPNYALGAQQATATTTDIVVVPNPNKGTFSVKGSMGVTSDEAVTMQISNMLGQVVYNNKTIAHNGRINEQVQLGNMAAGMYLLSVRSAAGTNVYHIVIEQ